MTPRPSGCQRLSNGKTFVATYNHVKEYDRTGQRLYFYNKGPSFYIYSAHKLRNGHILCMTAQGRVLHLDAAGNEIRSFQIANNGNWCSVRGLANGNYLVALMGLGKVREVDAAGKP